MIAISPIYVPFVKIKSKALEIQYSPVNNCPKLNKLPIRNTFIKFLVLMLYKKEKRLDNATNINGTHMKIEFELNAKPLIQPRKKIKIGLVLILFLKYSIIL
jgi:hypothetical protein